MSNIVLAELKTELGIDEAGQDGLLQDKIDAAITYIEQTTLRVFVAATGTRVYQRDSISRYDSSELQLDGDIVTVTALLNADSANTAIAAANYWLLDRNLGPPYRAILLDSTQHWQFDQDEWVSVTGTWGYSADCPADVKAAQLHMAAFLFRQKDSQVFVTTAIPEQGVIQIPQGIPATVTRVIDKYRRRWM